MLEKSDYYQNGVIIQRNSARACSRRRVKPIFPRRTQKLPRRIRYYVVAATFHPTRAIIFPCLRRAKHPTVFSRHQPRKKKKDFYITRTVEDGIENSREKHTRLRNAVESRIRTMRTFAFVRIRAMYVGTRIGLNCVNQPTVCLSETIDAI